MENDCKHPKNVFFREHSCREFQITEREGVSTRNPGSLCFRKDIKRGVYYCKMK